MIKHLLAVLLFSLLIGCSGQVRLVEPAELVEFEPNPLEFGVVARDTERSLTPIVRNDGRVPVDLRVIEIPPGFSVDPTSVSLGPGARLAVNVGFQPPGLGRSEGRIRFESRSGAEFELSVNAIGVADVLDVPDSVDFGGAYIGTKTTRSLTIRNNTDESLTVVSELTADEFAIVEQDFVELPPFGSGSVQLSFAPHARGDAAAWLTLRHCSGCEDVQVGLTGRGLEKAIQVVPDTVDFGVVALGLVVSRRVAVVNVGDGPVSLALPRKDSIEGRGFRLLDVDVAEPLAVEAAGTIELEFSPAHEVRAEGKIVLEDIDGSQLATIMLSGTGGGPKLAVSPEVLEFGIQPLGRSVARWVRIKNIGAPASVHVLSVSIVGDDGDSFSADLQGPIVVGEDGVDFSIELLASRAGKLSAKAVVLSDLEAQPLIELPIVADSVAGGPCDLRMEKERLRLGLVYPGDERQWNLAIANNGDEPCLVWDFAVEGEDALFFAIDSELSEVEILAGRETLNLALRLESEAVPVERFLSAAISFRSGSVHSSGYVIPISAYHVKQTPFWGGEIPEPVLFAETPIGQASIGVTDFVSGNGIPVQYSISDDSSPAFRLPSSQKADGHATPCPACSEVIRIAFAPSSEGVHRGQLEIKVDGHLAERYLVDLSGLAVPACRECGWPEATCPPSIRASVLEDVAFLASGGGDECNWSVGVPSMPTGGSRVVHRDYLLDLTTSESCNGVFRGNVVGDFVLNNIEVYGGSRGAVCQTTIHVDPPGGMWIEAVPALNLVSPDVAVLLLHGDGGDPGEEASWYDESFVCNGSTLDSSKSCGWDSASGLGDPRLIFPAPSRPTPALLWIPEPSALQSYSIGLSVTATKQPGTLDPIPAAVNVYCGGQPVSTKELSFRYDYRDLRVVGTIAFPESGGCEFVEDGNTVWPLP